MSEIKNYMTPAGHAALQNELYQLVNKERPEIVQIVNWAASNGDRSENGDYLYGKRRMREIDRRIRFLTKRHRPSILRRHGYAGTRQRRGANRPHCGRG